MYSRKIYGTNSINQCARRLNNIRFFSKTKFVIRTYDLRATIFTKKKKHNFRDKGTVNVFARDLHVFHS